MRPDGRPKLIATVGTAFARFRTRIPPHAERARREGWIYRELYAPHDPHAFDPNATATLLDELATL
jgi:hypothetical protein